MRRRAPPDLLQLAQQKLQRDRESAPPDLLRLAQQTLQRDRGGVATRNPLSVPRHAAPQPAADAVFVRRAYKGATLQQRADASVMLSLLEEETNYGAALNAQSSEIGELREKLRSGLDAISEIEPADVGCETIGTTVSLLWNAPSVSLFTKAFVLLICVLCFTLQLMLVLKLYRNGYAVNASVIADFIREDFMQISSAASCPPDSSGTQCRLTNADLFVEQQDARSANPDLRNERVDFFRRDDDLEGRPSFICFTEAGLQNGFGNIAMCMLIVITTVMRDAFEAVAVSYTISHDRGIRTLLSVLWGAVVGIFHAVLLFYSLSASFRIMSHQSNSLWACLEASVSIFLVSQIDDSLLYCILRHPEIIDDLERLGVREVTRDLMVDGKRLPPRTKHLVSRRSFVNFKKDGRDMRKAEREGRLGQMAEEMSSPRAGETGEDDEEQYFDTGATLIVPTEWVRHSAGGTTPTPYRNFLELVLWYFFTVLLGNRLIKYCDFACVEVADELSLRWWAETVLHDTLPWIPVLGGFVRDVRNIHLDWDPRERLIYGVRVQYHIVAKLVVLYMAVALAIVERLTSRATGAAEIVLWSFCLLVVFVLVPAWSALITSEHQHDPDVDSGNNGRAVEAGVEEEEAAPPGAAAPAAAVAAVAAAADSDRVGGSGEVV